jgi:D-3-phosphoglycerate dehydrogenase
MRAAGIDVDVRGDITLEDLAGIIGEYEGIVVRSRTKVRKDLIDKATRLKVIIRGGAGLDSIDVDHAQGKGIDVRNTPSANANAVAELALGMMISLARHIAMADCSMKAGRWEKKQLRGTEIAGKTLGVVGYGRIGQLLGQKARALGMNVVAYDPYVELPDIIPLDEVLASADYISLHVPMTTQTAGFIGTEAFAKIKKGAYLIQASRGGTVDEAALYEALTDGVLSGAALDVFIEEPPKSDLLLKLVGLPNVVATPHIGAATVEAQNRVGEEIIKIATSYLA